MNLTYHTYPISRFLVSIVGILMLTACGCSKRSEHKGAEAARRDTIAIDYSIRDRLEEFARQPRAEGQFGFYVYDLTADKPVYGFNEREAQSSASCMKLLSGVAGLQLLGTKYVYQTSIYTRGKVADNTLKGDVTFQADLDPQLNEPDLRQFAQALRRKGIRDVEGRVYVDLFLHEPVRSEEHWYPWDLNFSKYGLLYKGAPRVVTELKHALRAQGIAVTDSQLVLGRVPKGSHCIYRFIRSIDRVTQRMWKNSSNTQATAMLYTIGRKISPSAEPTKAGLDYLRKFLRDDLGLTDSALVVHDGCGLCTHNKLSPLALTTILRYGYQHKPIYDMLNRQLSIAGVDGTLAREMTGPKTRGKIRAKTGTLSHPYGISSLAGYCKASDGHTLAFAIMDCDMSVLDARVLQRKLCEILTQ